jgi:hypothetical protein
MKKLSRVLLVALFVLVAGGHASAELKMKSVTMENEKPHVKKEHYVTMVATIQAINLKKRVVTLKGEGRVFDVKVGPEAKNLAQLKRGDEVTIKYYDAVSAKVYKAGQAPSVTGKSATLETAKKGAKPGGKYAAESTITATIESIDMKKPTVTLKTHEGKQLTVKIEEPKLLEKVTVGDEVVITYSEAIAISVEKTKKKGNK